MIINFKTTTVKKNNNNKLDFGEKKTDRRFYLFFRVFLH